MKNRVRYVRCARKHEQFEQIKHKKIKNYIINELDVSMPRVEFCKQFELLISLQVFYIIVI